MAFNIEEFKANGIINGGARPSQFSVEMNAPPAIQLDDGARRRFTFLCKGAELPGFQLGAIQVFYFGRATKIAGDRVFDDWTVSVMNDEDFDVRAMFEKWNNAMNAMISNYRDTGGSTADAAYKADMIVNQWAKDGSIVRSYKLVGAFPTIVSAIGLDWEQGNAIEMFNVTFSYDYFVLDFQNTPDQYDGIIDGDPSTAGR